MITRPTTWKGWLFIVAAFAWMLLWCVPPVFLAVWFDSHATWFVALWLWGHFIESVCYMRPPAKAPLFARLTNRWINWWVDHVDGSDKL